MSATSRPAPKWTSSRRRRGVVLALGLVGVVAAGCSGDSGADLLSEPPTTTTTAPTYEPTFPDDEWETVSPEKVGLDPAALETMADAAEAGGSECLVVTHEGRIVGEWYWGEFQEDTEREVFSVTKSITAALVGIAQDRGHLDIDQPASDFIEEWKGTPSEAVTIRNILANDSGRFQSAATDYAEMPASPDQTAFAIGLEQEHEPGTVWAYNNAAIQTLDQVIEKATGMPTHQFAEEALFQPIGMESEIAQDPSGNTATFMGAQASCRDLARFGHLFMNDGEWDGEQIVSAEFVEQATTPSQELNPGYGYLWWLNQPGSLTAGTAIGEPNEELGLAPSGPEDMFAAQGLNKQYIDVFPSWGFVVTRLGAAKGEDGEVEFTNEDVAVGVRDARGFDATE